MRLEPFARRPLVGQLEELMSLDGRDRPAAAAVLGLAVSVLMGVGLPNSNRRFFAAGVSRGDLE
jgi:hypothetical protein